jgi:flagellar protein FlbD
MIYVTRLNGKIFYVNAELIQLVEATPDTVITLTNNVKYVVKDKVEDVVNRIIEYRRKIYHSRPVMNEEQGVK